MLQQLGRSPMQPNFFGLATIFPLFTESSPVLCWGISKYHLAMTMKKKLPEDSLTTTLTPSKDTTLHRILRGTSQPRDTWRETRGGGMSCELDNHSQRQTSPLSPSLQRYNVPSITRLAFKCGHPKQLFAGLAVSQAHSCVDSMDHVYLRHPWSSANHWITLIDPWLTPHSNLVWQLDLYSVDTRFTFNPHLDWHSINTWSTLDQQLVKIVSRVLTDPYILINRHLMGCLQK